MSVQLQEIDVELLITSKIYLKKTAKIAYLKELASKEFKHLGHHGSDFDYFVAGNELLLENDNNSIETLASYKTNKIVLKPSSNYKNQYEDIRKTIDEGMNTFFINNRF